MIERVIAVKVKSFDRWEFEETITSVNLPLLPLKLCKTPIRSLMRSNQGQRENSCWVVFPPFGFRRVKPRLFIMRSK